MGESYVSKALRLEYEKKEQGKTQMLVVCSHRGLSRVCMNCEHAIAHEVTSIDFDRDSPCTENLRWCHALDVKQLRVVGEVRCVPVSQVVIDWKHRYGLVKDIVKHLCGGGWSYNERRAAQKKALSFIDDLERKDKENGL